MPNLVPGQFPAAYDIWLQTGWNSDYQIDFEMFAASWERSPVKKGIFHHSCLVAIGRANTDGVLYAMIHDVVVHRDFRGQGYGREIMIELVSELKSMGIRVIQLMAAQNQAGFYEKLGFRARALDRPGMQYIIRPAQHP